MKPYRFQQTRKRLSDDTWMWGWELFDENDKPIATALVHYDSDAECTEAIKKIKQHVPIAIIGSVRYRGNEPINF